MGRLPTTVVTLGPHAQRNRLELDNSTAAEVQNRMAFQLYDSRAKKQVQFEPMVPGQVSLYHCGPTVYSTAHIGNFRSFLFADTLRRYLGIAASKCSR